VIDTCTVSRDRPPIAASSAASRVTSALFVMRPRRRPRSSRSTSSSARVTPKRRSAGWYGSVAVPIASGSPRSTIAWCARAPGRSAWRSSRAASRLTRMRRSKASHGGSGTASPNGPSAALPVAPAPAARSAAQRCVSRA
jgi:hypothetical protein